MVDLEEIALMTSGVAAGYFSFDYLRARQIYSASDSAVKAAIMDQQHHQPVSLPPRSSAWAIGVLSVKAKRHYESVYKKLQEGEKITYADLSSERNKY